MSKACTRDVKCKNRFCTQHHPNPRLIENTHFCPSKSFEKHHSNLTASVEDVRPPQRPARTGDMTDDDIPKPSPALEENYTILPMHPCFVIDPENTVLHDDGFQITFDEGSKVLTLIVSIANVVRCVGGVRGGEELLQYARKVLENTYYGGYRATVWPETISHKASLLQGIANEIPVVSMTIQFQVNENIDAATGEVVGPVTYTLIAPATFMEEYQTSVVNFTQSTVDRCVCLGINNGKGLDISIVAKLRMAYQFAQRYLGYVPSSLGPSPLKQHYSISIPHGIEISYDYAQTPSRVITSAMIALFNVNAQAYVAAAGYGSSLVQCIHYRSEVKSPELLEKCKAFVKNFPPPVPNMKLPEASYGAVKQCFDLITNVVASVEDIMDALSESEKPQATSFSRMRCVPYGSVPDSVSTVPCKFTSPLRSFVCFYHQHVLISVIRRGGSEEETNDEFNDIMRHVIVSVEALCTDLDKYHHNVMSKIASAESEFIVSNFLEASQKEFQVDLCMKNFHVIWTAMVTSSSTPSTASVSLLNNRSLVHTAAFHKKFVEKKKIAIKHNKGKSLSTAPVIFENVPLDNSEVKPTPLSVGSLVYVLLDMNPNATSTFRIVQNLSSTTTAKKFLPERQHSSELSWGLDYFKPKRVKLPK
eukprot:PhF_6_TR36506/c0_g1_i6/m.53730